MGHLKAVLAAAVFTLAACTDVKQEIYAPVSADRIAPAVNIIRHDVIVPRELTTSEANLYYPLVDLVWRDDPPGDRHAQVQVVIEDALDWGLAAFNQGQRVVVTVEVTKFHALTQKARYSVGGFHTMRFDLLVSNVADGTPILGPIAINADLIALGGNKAIESDAAGRTQKARITQHIAGTVQQHLLAAGLGRTRPDDG